MIVRSREGTGPCACVQQEEAAPSAEVPVCKPASEEDRSGEADDMTCAICLEQIIVEDLCVVKGCEHVYCGKCILGWAMHKDPVWCPQCKTPFSALLTHRKLDGSLSDFPVEESLCLLKRSTWFAQQLKDLEKGKSPALPLASAGSGRFEEADGRDWADWQDAVERAHYARFEEEFEDDDEVEAFYFSAAAGRARITLGNRRFGEGGFMAAGRQRARPVQQPRDAGKGKAAASAPAPPQQHRGAHKTVGADFGDEPATPARVPPRRAPNSRSKKGTGFSDGSEGACTPGSSSSNGSAACGSGSAGGKSGRRARRKEKQASADARAALLSSP